MVTTSAGTADLVTFTEDVLNVKLYFLCSDTSKMKDLLTHKILMRVYSKPSQTHLR